MKRLFFCPLLLSILALAPNTATASPMIGHIGSADVTLSLSPDPPQPGPEHATVTVTGVSPDALAHTTLTFVSQMPSMTMKGSSGSASAVAGRAGVWGFDLPTAMATQWVVALRFSGGVNGFAAFTFDVVGSSASGAGTMNMSQGADGTWRVAAFALTVLFIIAAAAAWSLAKTRDASAKPTWMTPSTVAIGIAGVVIVLGLAVIQSRFAPPAMDMSTMSNVLGTAAVPVALATVTDARSGTTIIAPGIIQPYLTQTVSARTPGIVQSVEVYVGDKISAGQTLATLSEPDLSAQAAAASAAADSDINSSTAAMIEAHHHAPNELIIAQEDARAKAEQARYWRNELQREKTLLDQGGVSPQEYQGERAQAAVAAAASTAAQRQVEDAQANIEMTRAAAAAAIARASSSSSSAAAQTILAGYTTLSAPDDAVVVNRLVDPGSYVESGTPILRLAVITKVRIQANVAQEDLSGITVGTPLTAVVNGGHPIRARVTAVQPAADPATHTAMIEAIVDNPGDRLRPGTYVRVSIGPIVGTRARGTVTPSASVIGSGQNAAVWTDVNGTAHRVAVTVLSDDGQLARVAGDLKPGDRVVIEGGQDLQEGTPIVQARS
jgi:multidrug efflux pump subunit AcrA (membrane-fusion protein)